MPALHLEEEMAVRSTQPSMQLRVILFRLNQPSPSRLHANRPHMRLFYDHFFQEQDYGETFECRLCAVN